MYYTTLTATHPAGKNFSAFQGFIQNHDTSPLFVSVTAGQTASSSKFDFILPACTAAKDGTSPVRQLPGGIGAISVYTAGSASYSIF